jgi:hypothetical protein
MARSAVTGAIWPGWYPVDDLEVEVLCGLWVWEPLAEQQRCPERSGIGRKL